MNIGLRAGHVKETGFSLHIAELMSRIQQKVNTFHISRTAMGGVALMGGMVLATGADTIPQALMTLAAFAVAGTCLHEKEEEGGEI